MSAAHPSCVIENGNGYYDVRGLFTGVAPGAKLGTFSGITTPGHPDMDVSYDQPDGWFEYRYFEYSAAETKPEYTNLNLTPGFTDNVGGTQEPVVPTFMTMPGEGNSSTTTFDLAFPVYNFRIIILDVDQADSVELTALDAHGDPITDFTPWAVTDGDYSVGFTNPAGVPLLDPAPPPNWDPATGILTSSDVQNANRSFTVLQPNEPISSYTLVYNSNDPTVTEPHVYYSAYGVENACPGNPTYGCSGAFGDAQFEILRESADKLATSVGVDYNVDGHRDFLLPGGGQLLPGDYRIFALVGDDHFVFRRDPGVGGPYTHQPTWEAGPLIAGTLNGGYAGDPVTQPWATAYGWHGQRSEQLYVQLDSTDGTTLSPRSSPDWGVATAYDNNGPDLADPADFNDLYDYVGSGIDATTGAQIDMSAYPGRWKEGTYLGQRYVMYEDLDNDWAQPNPFPPEVVRDKGFYLGDVTLSQAVSSIRVRHIGDVDPTLADVAPESVQPIKIVVECATPPPVPVATPYFTVDGAIAAGGGRAPTPGYGADWCAAPSALPNTQDAGYIRGAAGVGGGAFATDGFVATSTIVDFGAGAVGGTTTAFANTPGAGSFNDEGVCIKDLNEYLSSDDARVGVSTTLGFPVASGQRVFSGNMTIGTQTIPEGRRITLLVDGDVTITGNITFANYDAGSIDDIPSFVLIATGDIDIQAGVTALDGIYHAGGKIDTCSNGPADLTATDCGQQLTVTGSFAATDIEFRRTFGSVDGGQPAEVFVTNGELYLADHIMLPDIPVDFGISSYKDLPPVVTP